MHCTASFRGHFQEFRFVRQTSVISPCVETDLWSVPGLCSCSCVFLWLFSLSFRGLKTEKQNSETRNTPPCAHFEILRDLYLYLYFYFTLCLCVTTRILTNAAAPPEGGVKPPAECRCMQACAQLLRESLCVSSSFSSSPALTR